MFLVFSGGLGLLWAIEQWQQHRFKIPRKAWLGLFILASGVLLALVQIIPPEDNALLHAATRIPFTERISKSLIGLFKGIVQFPDFSTLNFWNSNFLVNWSKPLSGVLGMASLFIPVFLFAKNRLILFFVYISIVVTFIMLYITQLSAARYHGIFVLIIITALWLEYEHDKRPFTVYRWIPENTLVTIRNTIIIGIFGLQLISGVTTYALDLARPFTQAKNSIAFLKANQLDKKFIATRACDGTALSAYLERPIFFTSYNKYCSYCIWGDPEQVSGRSQEEVLQTLKRLLLQRGESIIFIAYQPFFNTDPNWVTTSNGLKYKFLQSFEESIIRKGNYYIYEVALSK